MARITTEYGATTTAHEVAAGVDLSGHRAIVTGGGSGIGVETARALASTGAEVTLAVRNVDAAEPVARDITATTGNENVRVAQLDLLDRSSIETFAAAWSGPLHLLINNAGVMALPTLERTSEGREVQFATNHLGHFALALGLHGALAAADGARIVSVSSTGHLASPVVFDDLDFRNREYDPWSAYGQSKTANVLFAVEATCRWSSDGIVANALMPGGIMTNLQRHVPQQVKDGWSESLARGEITMKTTQQGAATTLVAALAPEFATGGCYLEDCNQARPVGDEEETSDGVRAWATDPGNARRLWDVSLELIGAA